jgi:hypothetical protein
MCALQLLRRKLIHRGGTMIIARRAVRFGIPAMLVIVSALLGNTASPSSRVQQKAGTTSSASAATPIPIAVIGVQVNPLDNTVRFSLRNDGVQTITAWHVRITSRAPSGATGTGRDGYRSFEGLSADHGHIDPGGTLTTIGPLPAQTELLTVTPDAAIFRDKSSVGNPKEIEFVFEPRASERAAWSDIVATLNSVIDKGAIGLSHLQRAASRLDQGILKSPDDPVRLNARRNLAIGIDDVARGKALPEVRFAHLLEQARRSLAAADRHTR